MLFIEQRKYGFFLWWRKLVMKLRYLRKHLELNRLRFPSLHNRLVSKLCIVLCGDWRGAKTTCRKWLIMKYCILTLKHFDHPVIPRVVERVSSFSFLIASSVKRFHFRSWHVAATSHEMTLPIFRAMVSKLSRPIGLILRGHRHMKWYSSTPHVPRTSKLEIS